MNNTKEFERAVHKEMARIGREEYAPKFPDLAETLEDDNAIYDTFAALEIIAAVTEQANQTYEEDSMASEVTRDVIREHARAMLAATETLENWNDELVEFAEQHGYKIRNQAMANVAANNN